MKFIYNGSAMAKIILDSKTKVQASTGNIGKLKIGDNWNAITIIALSQNNPLKAIAEFVENSIDACARHITIIRGKEHGKYYLKIIDDGTGIPQNHDGIPDFKYVATHICDSIKKRLKKQGVKGIQGEFGIGLLSFWTVGQRLILISAGKDGKAYQMEMRKNEPGYKITQKRTLFAHSGTELVIHPLLPGIRQLTGEKIQNYLASELRDRIRSSSVKIKIKDRFSRKEYNVEPRQFTGRLLHNLPAINTLEGEIYFEIYFNTFSTENSVWLYRQGTRVLSSLTKFDQFNLAPWNSGYLQGMIDVPFINITPGTRDGIIQDEQFERFYNALSPLCEKLNQIIEEEKRAEEEKASKDILKSVQRALKEAFLALSREEYDWFNINLPSKGKAPKNTPTNLNAQEDIGSGATKVAEKQEELKLGISERMNFYEYAGPLYKVIITPASAVIGVGASKNFRVIARDKNKRTVENALEIYWEIKQGEGALKNIDNEVVTYSAPPEPGITILQVTVTQGEIVCIAESIVTITDTLIKKDEKSGSDIHKGLPGYTFKHAPGELWRSHYDEAYNLIVINNGHADYIFASKKRARKLKYICKLFAKELVLKNFIGYSNAEILEYMVELSLYTEEHLK